MVKKDWKSLESNNMGIRINTVMGWGFRYSKGLEDPRISRSFRNSGLRSENFLCKYKKALEKIASKSIDDADYNPDIMDAKLLIDRLDGRAYGKEIPRTTSLTVDDFIHYTGFLGEYLKASPMVFIPIEHTDDWFRHDDIIDYYDNGSEDSVKMIVDDGGYPCPIFPYARYINRKTGNSFSGTYASAFLDMRRYEKISSIPLEKMVSETATKELSNLGISTMDELRRDIVPMIPISLRIFFETFNVFENPLTMYRLRPIIYKFWC
jgi:hypothetical protein